MPRQSQSIMEFFNVPWDSELRNLRYFGSASERDSYFNSHYHRQQVMPHPTTGNTSVIKASPVKNMNEYCVDRNWDALNNFNYMRFINKGYEEGDWTYCFIDYIRSGWEHTCFVGFHIDPWINNIGRMHFNQSFIERCHTKEDAITYQPEPISCNSYVTKYRKTLGGGSSAMNYYLLATDTWVSESKKNTQKCTIDGYREDVFMLASESWEEIQKWVNMYDEAGTANRIIGVFGVPNDYINIRAKGSQTHGDAEIVFQSHTNQSVSRFAGSYSPRNKKCLIYPYCYCVISDKQKSTRIFRWEDGTEGGTLSFDVSGYVGPGGSAVLLPQFSQTDKTWTDNLNTNITTQIAHSVSGWNQWLAQNQSQIKAQQTNQALSTGLALAGTAAGVATGNIGLASASGTAVTQMVGQMQNANNISATMESAKFQSNPVQMGDGSMKEIIKLGMTNFAAYAVYPRKKDFQSIDDFFTKFGYAFNRVGSIIPTNRSAFCYYKTNGATVTGMCPQMDRNAIMQALDRGVTFWHNDNIGNYSQTNS